MEDQKNPKFYRYKPSAQFSCKNKNFVYTNKKLLKNRNKTFSVKC